MSYCIRANHPQATTERHIDSTDIHDSAVASRALTDALKKEALCIAINRKAEILPKLTIQDFQALAEHAANILREETLGLLDASDINPADETPPGTLADNIDVNPRPPKRQRLWELRDPATVDNYPCDGHKLQKLKHASSKEGRGK
jgi:hypothetical protein